MSRMNPKLIHVSKHIRDSSIAAHLSDNLHQQYHTRSLRVIKGDTVRVMRGEYNGIEGKASKEKKFVEEMLRSGFIPRTSL